jgi:UDP-N-acetylglucosamine diphosphorylase/glucosamine-1-phosphate N-acetyltransferase
MTSICVFEDDGYSALLPLTWFKPVFDLRCGINTLCDKIKRQYPRTNIYLLCREYLSTIVKRDHPGSLVGKIGKEAGVLFINGRLLCEPEIAKKLPLAGGDEIFECGGVIVAARLSKGNLELVSNSITAPVSKNSFASVLNTAKTTQVKVKLIDHLYDLIAENAEQIKADFSYYTRGGITRGKVHQSVAVHSGGSVYVDDGADVEAFCTLDARRGPIYISKGVTILPNSRIEGPSFIGEKSVITMGANIRGGTSIGENCRVGGEVEETIFQGYSNKAHYGFLGHSYIAEWVNLGAGATNSNLKNTYSSVKIDYAGKETDSGRMFLGCVIADHTKVGIGVLINTGSVMGAASNVFGSNLTHKFVPSFSWGNSHKLVKYDPEKAIKTAKIVMARRDVEMEDADVDLFRKIFELTEGERENSGVV